MTITDDDYYDEEEEGEYDDNYSEGSGSYGVSPSLDSYMFKRDGSQTTTKKPAPAKQPTNNKSNNPSTNAKSTPMANKSKNAAMTTTSSNNSGSKGVGMLMSSIGRGVAATTTNPQQGYQRTRLGGMGRGRGAASVVANTMQEDAPAEQEQQPSLSQIVENLEQVQPFEPVAQHEQAEEEAPPPISVPLPATTTTASKQQPVLLLLHQETISTAPSMQPSSALAKCLLQPLITTTTTTTTVTTTTTSTNSSIVDESFAQALVNRNMHEHNTQSLSSSSILNLYFPYLVNNKKNNTKKSFAFDEPSPDDLVTLQKSKSITAQVSDHHVNSKKPAITTTTTTTTKPIKVATPTKTPASLATTFNKVQEPKPKAEVKPFVARSMPKDATEKPRVNMVIIGHVDAGKSTMMGHLLVQLGHVSDKIIHKYKKESQEIGKVMDEQDEERARGITMDIGVRYLETPHRMITVLDAPGHKDFIPNMITGAAQADVALLVVDALPGGFESGLKGQTREHLVLVRSLGVTQLLVAVNKLDSMQWNRERFDAIVAQLTPIIKQIGFTQLTCENLTKPIPSNVASAAWYKGKTLVQHMDEWEPNTQNRALDKPFRFAISDVYKSVHGTGVTVAGRIDSGFVSCNDKITLVIPVTRKREKTESSEDQQVELQQQQSSYSGFTTEQGTVKLIYRHKQSITTAYSGDNVELGINGIDIQLLSVGQVLCLQQEPAIPVTNRIVARIITFELDVPLVKGAELVLHIQHINVPVTLKRLYSTLHKQTLEVDKKKPKCIPKQTTALVQLSTDDHPVCVELFSENRAFGRFLLRTGGKTVATGVITKLKKCK